MKIKVLFIIFSLISMRGLAQHHFQTDGLQRNTPPPEAISLYLNTNFFLTGETMLFSVYCFTGDSVSQRLSNLSKVAYVEVIGKDSKPLSQMKVPLTGGVGYGDVFFGADVPTGNYTVIAYTKWMRNFGPSTFFKQVISIINPNNPPVITTVNSTEQLKSVSKQIQYNSGIQVDSLKSGYGQREKVVMYIQSRDSLKLSVNVRLVDEGMPKRISWKQDRSYTGNVSQFKFLPDFRGELISGRVTLKDTNKPVSKKEIMLSAPSGRYSFNVSQTDSAGNFFFARPSIQGDYFLIKVDGYGGDEISIETHEGFRNDYDSFKPTSLVVDSTLLQVIQKRYVNVQVENAFFSVKKDSVIHVDEVRRFYGKADKVYYLDDYTRFSNMEDIFREIIPEVVVKLRNGLYSLVLKNETSGYRFQNSPLVLVDGIPVNDANVLMRYNPGLIKSISLVKRHYYYGSIDADGIISIETFQGTAPDLDTSNMTRFSYKPSVLPKIYYSPDYSSQTDLTRIPDFRTQLYWEPVLSFHPDKSHKLVFFTGDKPGNYVVEVAGVSSAGEKLFWQKTFSVK